MPAARQSHRDQRDLKIECNLTHLGAGKSRDSRAGGRNQPGVFRPVTSSASAIGESRMANGIARSTRERFLTTKINQRSTPGMSNLSGTITLVRRTRPSAAKLRYPVVQS